MQDALRGQSGSTQSNEVKMAMLRGKELML